MKLVFGFYFVRYLRVLIAIWTFSFIPAEWEVKEEGKEVAQQWEDDWDDDDVNDDFSQQLKKELENNTEKSWAGPI